MAKRSAPKREPGSVDEGDASTGAAPPRKRRWKRILLVAMVVLVVLVGAIVVLAAPMAGGYASKIACSEVFVAGRDLERVQAEDLAPYGFVSLETNAQAKTATASLLGLFPVTSAFRPGLGCAIAHDSPVDALRAQGFEPPAIEERAADELWPKGSKPYEDAIEGLDREALEAALGRAFEEPNPDQMRLTRAVVVVWDGKLIAERYADGLDASSRLLGWSMTKSVTSALIGVAVHRGLLSTKEAAGFDAWSEDERRAITVDQLLRMSSGLSFSEVYAPLTDATEMLFESEDTAAAAMQHDAEAAPDAVWSYSSATTNLISKILRDRIGDDAAYHRFPYEALFEPLGMRSALMEADASGTYVGSSFMYATARDWARFGLLYEDDGLAFGERILPEGWVDYTRTPTKPAPQGCYGAQFWLNKGEPDDESDRKFPSLPTDLYYASGFQGQAVMIVPSRDAVIVRLGVTHERGAFPMEEMARDILAALPHRAP